MNELNAMKKVNEVLSQRTINYIFLYMSGIEMCICSNINGDILDL
jgi:hypothetical protein